MSVSSMDAQITASSTGVDAEEWGSWVSATASVTPLMSASGSGIWGSVMPTGSVSGSAGSASMMPQGSADLS